MWPAVKVYATVDKEAGETRIFHDHIAVVRYTGDACDEVEDYELAKDAFKWSKHGTPGPSVNQLLRLCKKSPAVEFPCIWHEWIVPRNKYLEFNSINNS